ncbi:hypothetical protein B0J11DRAFT_52026 [Dendryphion nanum]|uniref:Uncharacterized protein n=1 Tax=Dendryphion nanum TaxID=256645 RepID=A0A9P9IIN2_9PLEO|nr:hypothetical protein B0J11DRAFT_52026 [Dendryphion nanum]
MEPPYPPLTTTFTPPPGCFGTFPSWAIHGTVHWFLQAETWNATTCFPTSFQFNPTATVTYSPGICPSGWTSACNSLKTFIGSIETIHTCCPSGLGCFPKDPDHRWESNFPCASPLYNIDRSAWSIPATASVASSQYNYAIQIMSQNSPSPGLSNTPTRTSVSAGTSSGSVLPSIVIPYPPRPGLAPGAKAAIAVGTILGVIFLAVIVYMAWRLGRQRRGTPVVSQPEAMQQPVQAYWGNSEGLRGQPFNTGNLNANQNPAMELGVEEPRK